MKCVASFFEFNAINTYKCLWQVMDGEEIRFLCCHKMFALKPTHCFSWVSQETEHPFYFDSWQPWRKCHGQKGMVAVSAVSTGAVILEVLPLIHSTIMHVYYQNHGNICMPAVKNLICHQMLNTAHFMTPTCKLALPPNHSHDSIFVHWPLRSKYFLDGFKSIEYLRLLKLESWNQYIAAFPFL